MPPQQGHRSGDLLVQGKGVSAHDEGLIEPAEVSVEAVGARAAGTIATFSDEFIAPALRAVFGPRAEGFHDAAIAGGHAQQRNAWRAAEGHGRSGLFAHGTRGRHGKCFRRSGV